MLASAGRHEAPAATRRRASIFLISATICAAVVVCFWPPPTVSDSSRAASSLVRTTFTRTTPCFPAFLPRPAPLRRPWSLDLSTAPLGLLVLRAALLLLAVSSASDDDDFLLSISGALPGPAGIFFTLWIPFTRRLREMSLRLGFMAGRAPAAVPCCTTRHDGSMLPIYFRRSTAILP
uniref:Uncharacterized protein n=1 Tax=Zea mays TaxID=4577 RepID=C4J1I6_MAIZE|nr:unknown [Zea mays]